MAKAQLAKGSLFGDQAWTSSTIKSFRFWVNARTSTVDASEGLATKTGLRLKSANVRTQFVGVGVSRGSPVSSIFLKLGCCTSRALSRSSLSLSFSASLDFEFHGWYESPNPVCLQLRHSSDSTIKPTNPPEAAAEAPAVPPRRLDTVVATMPITARVDAAPAATVVGVETCYG